jgi:hypothetical protein
MAPATWTWVQGRAGIVAGAMPHRARVAGAMLHRWRIAGVCDRRWGGR